MTTLATTELLDTGRSLRGTAPRSALGTAHAQSCEPAVIAGYLGRGASFDEAMSRFALAYADQNDRDHAAFVDALASGRLQADPGIAVP